MKYFWFSVLALVLAPLNNSAVAQDMLVWDAGNQLGWVEDANGNSIYGTPQAPLQHPLVFALENTGAAPFFGFHIQVQPGRYQAFKMQPNGAGAKIVNRLGGTSTNPVVVEGVSGAVIERVPTNNLSGDTVFVLSGGQAQHSFNHITWKTLRFEASGRSGFLIGTSQDALGGIKFENWRFEDCEVDGQYDHLTSTGFQSKWGFHTWAMSNFAFLRGSVHNTSHEHAFYMHTNAGPVTIQDTSIYETGRTAIQIVARKHETSFKCPEEAFPVYPVNPHNIHVLGCTISDTGLFSAANMSGDNYHNGQSITVVGRNTGRIEILGNRIEYGLNTTLRTGIMAKSNYPAIRPWGNGSVLFWTTCKEDYESSNKLVFEGNTVEYEANSCAYPPVIIAALRTAIVKNNAIASGVRPEGISLGGLNPLTQPVPNNFCVDGNVLTGTNGSYIYYQNVPLLLTQPISSGIPCP